MLLREAELGRQMFSHEVAVEQRDRTAADLEELDQQDVGDRRLARSREAGEEHSESLLEARRDAAPQLGATAGKVNHAGMSRPSARRLRSSVPDRSTTSRTSRHFVFGKVLIEIFDVDHDAERHHR